MSDATPPLRPGPLRKYKRLLWGVFLVYGAVFSLAAAVGAISVLARGGPLIAASTELVIPVDAFAAGRPALERCHADLDRLHHQLRERVASFGIAIRRLDPKTLDDWRRWSASWQVLMEQLGVRCHLLDPPAGAHPAIIAMAEGYAMLRGAGDRYLAGLESLAKDQSLSLAGAARAIAAAKRAIAVAGESDGVPGGSPTPH